MWNNYCINLEVPNIDANNLPINLPIPMTYAGKTSNGKPESVQNRRPTNKENEMEREYKKILFAVICFGKYFHNFSTSAQIWYEWGEKKSVKFCM